MWIEDLGVHGVKEVRDNRVVMTLRNCQNAGSPAWKITRRGGTGGVSVYSASRPTRLIYKAYNRPVNTHLGRPLV